MLVCPLACSLCSQNARKISLFFLSFQTSPNGKEVLNKKFKEELEIRIKHDQKG